MGFETPDEGYLAKILVEAGTKDVAIGKLVCIIVENEEDVAAFKNFKDTGDAEAAAPAAPAPVAEPVSVPQVTVSPPAATGSFFYVYITSTIIETVKPLFTSYNSHLNDRYLTTIFFRF